MAEVILVCRHCDRQPAACQCADKGSFADRHWLRQEPVIRVRELRVPISLAKGQLEYLNDEELYDHFNDLKHEVNRREQNEYSTLAEHRLEGESG